MQGNIVNKDTMRKMDAATLKREGISEYTLMKRAGQALANHIITADWFNPSMKTVILCGPGNNGGDGMIVGKVFMDKAYDVLTVVFGDDDKRSDATNVAKSTLNKTEKTWDSNDNWDDLDRLLKQADIIVDALFGIGVSGDLREPYKHLVHMINKTKAIRIAIDLPTGLNADTGEAITAMQADLTLAVQCLKYGHLMQDGKDVCGKIEVVDVGIKPIDAYLPRRIVGLEALAHSFQKRSSNSHKYNYGNVMIMGGTKMMPGAPSLAAHAAYRGGSGLVSHLKHENDDTTLSQALLEVMQKQYKTSNDLKAHLEKADAIVFGVGMGPVSKEKQEALGVLLSSNKPLVIDADGLTVFKALQHHDLPHKSFVLTPHEGEFKRLANTDTVTVEAAEHYNKTVGGVLVLKGLTTLIVYKGVASFMPLGTAALATAGTGDILSGLIASRLGMGASLFDAAIQGVLLHALAGIKASEKMGEHAMIASDLLTALPEVVKSLTPLSIGRFQ